MMSRLQRWGNKRAIAAVAVPLHTWLRQGDYDIRLKCFRDMCLDPDTSLPSTETSSPEELTAKCQSLGVEFLLNFAKGTIAEGETDRKGKPITNRNPPYGVDAHHESHFPSLPKTWFGATMAALYPFLCEDRDQWTLRINGKLGNFAHPAPGLWPLQQVKRHVHFQKTMKDKFFIMLTTYKDHGGTFSSSEDEDDDVDDDDDGDSEGEQEQKSDCDDVF